LPAEVKKATEDFMEESIRWLTQVLEVGREQKEFVFTGDAAPRALSILAVLQGARQMARIHGIKLLQDVVGQIRRDLGLAV
jgi:hypothetical protein